MTRRIIKVFSNFLLLLTGVILAGQILCNPCARAQEDLVVQPASRDITLTGYTLIVGSDHGRTPPIKELAQKQGRFQALDYLVYPQKDAFKKKGSAVK
jgi:hypothetical protein